MGSEARLAAATAWLEADAVAACGVRTAFDSSPVATVVCDGSGTVRALNSAAGHLLGVDPEQVVGCSAGRLLGPEQSLRGVQAVRRAAQGSSLDRVVTIRRADGQQRQVRARWHVDRTPAGEPVVVTELVHLSDELDAAARELGQRFTSLFEASPVGMALVSPDGRFAEVNRRLCDMLGYSPSELQQRSFLDVTHPDDAAPSQANFEALLSGSVREVDAEKRYLHRDGSIVWTRRIGSVVAADDGSIQYVLIQAEDTSELREARDELTRLAYFDSLTGLRNRASLRLVAQDMLGCGTTALILLDLDDFKRVNDTLGHQAGDELLRTLAGRLAAVVGRDDVLGRLGGDEFVVVTHRSDTASLRALADGVVALGAEPFRLGGADLHVGISAGVAVALPGSDIGELLRHADLALYAAKRGGRSRHAVYDPQMHMRSAEDFTLERALRAAVDADGLSVVYQPIHRLSDGTLIGVEALCRWHDPVLGPVPPDRFIPVAEQSDLIHRLGEQVLRTASRDVAAMTGRTTRDLLLTVNVATAQLSEPGFAQTVAECLRGAGLAANRLVLEVTESSLAVPGSAVEATCAELQVNGVRLAIDDFGTGYSSLGRLRTSPFQLLKLDRMFLDDASLGSAGSMALSRAGVALGHGIGALVVAEGIETTEHLERMRRLGCDYGQGYLLGRPQSAEGLVLADYPVPREWAAADSTPAAVDGGVLAGGADPHDPVSMREVLRVLAHITRLDAVYLTEVDWRSGRQRVVLAHNAEAVRVGEGWEANWEDSLCRRALSAPVPAWDAPPPDLPPALSGFTGAFVAVPVPLRDGSTGGTLCGASVQPTQVDANVITQFRHFASLLGRCVEGRAVPD